VLAAQGESSPQAEEALEALCRTYWYPLYAYVRSRGYRREEAQDLTQEFLSRFVAKHYLERVAPEKGRFRSFLLACMKHFLADEWDKARTLKRGGHIHFLSWDEGVEARVERDLVLALNPEKLFARQWALAVLDTVKTRLQAYYLESGKQELYDRVYPYLRGDSGQPSYAETARQLDMSEAAVEAAARRMRRRYALWLREQVARTVHDAADVDDELRFLRQSLAP
jgi:RNA polymerase sigma-70 factor (ECF subfamily)